ncbi:MAG: response regulator, partial [Deltaproteobacteria bacterium]|nr:response regulator [Deltaproteobacteria bacterium]
MKIVGFNNKGNMYPEDDIKRGAGKVLVIDDDPALVQLVAEMLEIFGYNAVSSTSSKEGLNIFRQTPDEFDLVITDMAMPELNGDQLAREIILIRKDIPIILCTGFNEDTSEVRAKETGITE